MTKREPIFNVPGGVLATLAVLIIVHATLSFLTPQQYEWWVLALAFIPARFAGFAAELPGGDTASVTSWITHMTVHADLMHLGFNAAWLLAFGSVLCARLGSLRFLAFSIMGGIAGALLFLAFNPGLAAPEHVPRAKSQGSPRRSRVARIRRSESPGNCGIWEIR